MVLMATKYNPDEIITRRLLDEAVEAILNGISILIKNLATKEEISKLATKEEVQQGFREVKNEIRWVKDDINGLKAEFSNTPSRKEFNQLKTKVDRILQ